MTKNIGINVIINGRQITRAGFDTENYVLTTMSTLVHRKDDSGGFIFLVSGLDSDAGIHVKWFNSELKLGDIITMEVIKGPFDKPNDKPAFSKEEELKQKLIRFYKLEEELKEYIKEF